MVSEVQTQFDSSQRNGLFRALKEEQDKLKQRNKPIKLGEYLQLIEDGTLTSENAYLNSAQSYAQALRAPGVRTLPSGYNEFAAFADRTDGLAVYGLHRPLESFVNSIDAAARIANNSQIIVIIAPLGAGKTTVANASLRALEDYSRTVNPPIYAIKDCPIQEHPLNLLPKNTRDYLRENYHINVTGQLCPHCTHRFEKEAQDGEFDLQNVELETLTFFAAGNRGIGVLDPTETTSLYSEDWEIINKRIKNSNRGVFVLSELILHGEDFLETLNDLFRGRELQIGSDRYKLDLTIVATTTINQWKSIQDNGDLQSLRQRADVIYATYPLAYSDEARIYQKLIDQSRLPSDFHIGPDALKWLAMAAVRTRLKNSKDPNGPSKTDKVDLYNGQNVKGFTQANRRKYEEDGFLKNEGLEGISPPIMEGLLAKILADCKKCLPPTLALSRIISMLEKMDYDDTFPYQSELEDELLEVRDDFDDWITRTVRDAFEEEEVKNTRFKLYLENAHKAAYPTTNLDHLTEIDNNAPDLVLLHEIENNIMDSHTLEPVRNEGFRKDQLLRLSGLDRKGQKPVLDDFPEIKEGIEKLLESSQKTVIETLTAIKPSPKQQELLTQATQRLVSRYGFCVEECAPDALTYVAKLLRRTHLPTASTTGANY